MEEKTLADNAGNGFPDISGVKNTEGLAAEALRAHEAPAGKVSETDNASSVSVTEPRGGVRHSEGLPEDNSSASDEADEETLDAEFEALIKGKYRQAYKRRMESTVRRRLKNGRARSIAVSTPSEGERPSVSCEKTESIPETEVAAPIGNTADASALIEAQRTKNRSRPTENGVGGSVGVVTRINVSALSGSDILGIIHRAGTGEKITFS